MKFPFFFSFSQGALRIGSPTCRLFSKISIVFHGQKTTDNSYLGGFGDKGIYVPGEIDVHGKQFHPTWSRLAATANNGDDRVHLQHNVNWEVLFVEKKKKNLFPLYVYINRLDNWLLLSLLFMKMNTPIKMKW